MPCAILLRALRYSSWAGARKARSSPRVPAAHHDTGRGEQNLQIETQTRLPHVPKIENDSPAHFFERCRFSAQPVHLCPAGYSGLHRITQCVIFNSSGEILVVGACMRTRAHQGHLAANNVYELRQLVDTGATEKTSDARYARVRLCYLRDAVAIFD